MTIRTIKRFMEHLDPRHSRVVALTEPSGREPTSGSSSVQHLPTAGEMVLFDRASYRRAVVERLMGFASQRECEQIMAQAVETRSAVSGPSSRGSGRGPRGG